MAAAPARDTGVPTRVNPYAQDQSYIQDLLQSTGGRTDTTSADVSERASQNINSSQSAINTTPQILDALHSLIADLSGVKTQQKSQVVTSQDAELEIPLLVQESSPGSGATQYSPGYAATTYYRDPRTGQMFTKAVGEAENARRTIQRQRMVTPAPSASAAGVATSSSGAAKDSLIAAGTEQQKQQIIARQEEIVRARAAQDIIGTKADKQVNAYSKEAAFSDAQALVNKSISDALEKVMPQITAASEGAGTSKGSMRALLTQRAAEKAGSEGAALGVQTASAYGAISNQAAGQGIQGQGQLAGVLELLTRSDPNSPVNLLLQALIGSKGLVENKTAGQSSDTSSNKSSTQQANIGAQDTITTTLKQILEPLAKANMRVSPTGGGVPTAQEVAATPRATDGGNYSIIEHPNPNSTLDQTYADVLETPSSDAVYLSSSEEVA